MEAVISPDTTEPKTTERQDIEHANESQIQSSRMPESSTPLSVPKLEASVPLSLSEQDMVVFGSVNINLADAFTAKIEAAITEGVDSLPLLDGDTHRGANSSNSNSNSNSNNSKEPTADEDKSPKQRLWEAIRYRFVRNVDVLEAYSGHHLTTLRKHPPATRKRIVAVLKHGVEALPSLETKASTDEAATEQAATEQSSKYPTRSELPSEIETKQLVEEMAKLKADLESAKQTRNALLASLQSTERAQQAVEGVATTVQENMPEGPIQEQVGEKLERGNTLGLLKEESTHLVRKLETVKRDRNQKSTSDESESFDFVQRDDPLFRASNRAGNKKHKPLSLEEAYRKDRRQMGLLADSTNNNGSTTSSVHALKSMAMASSMAPLRMAAPRTPSH